MGFVKELKEGFRREGLWLDHEQARVLLSLVERGYRTGLLLLSDEEARLFSRLVERCRELKP